jgi:hypothetical protein
LILIHDCPAASLVTDSELLDARDDQRRQEPQPDLPGEVVPEVAGELRLAGEDTDAEQRVGLVAGRPAGAGSPRLADSMSHCPWVAAYFVAGLKAV